MCRSDLLAWYLSLLPQEDLGYVVDATGAVWPMHQTIGHLQAMLNRWANATTDRERNTIGEQFFTKLEKFHGSVTGPVQGWLSPECTDWPLFDWSKAWRDMPDSLQRQRQRVKTVKVAAVVTSEVVMPF